MLDASAIGVMDGCSQPTRRETRRFEHHGVTAVGRHTVSRRDGGIQHGVVTLWLFFVRSLEHCVDNSTATFVPSCAPTPGRAATHGTNGFSTRPAVWVLARLACASLHEWDETLQMLDGGSYEGRAAHEDPGRVNT
jgi:hypothetical protein